MKTLAGSKPTLGPAADGIAPIPQVPFRMTKGEREGENEKKDGERGEE
jgi:hypothetical protein